MTHTQWIERGRRHRWSPILDEDDLMQARLAIDAISTYVSDHRDSDEASKLSLAEGITGHALLHFYVGDGWGLERSKDEASVAISLAASRALHMPTGFSLYGG